LRGVKGDWDETSSLPPSMVVQHGPLRLGVIHGHQVVPLGDPEMLAAAARKMDVDVLISGGTHRCVSNSLDQLLDSTVTDRQDTLLCTDSKPSNRIIDSS